jgi:mono/diheme cytochrome c family protein
VKRLLLVLAACGSAPKAASVPAIATKLPAEVGTVVGIAEVGDATVILDHDHAFVVRGGALAPSVPAPHGWRGAATVAALDGEGAWAVGLADDGRLYRITLAGDLEDITDRFRLDDVRAFAAAGTTTAFALPDGVAVSGDGIHELRAKLATPTALAASNGRIALLGPKGIDVWDLAKGESRSYAIAARSVAFVGGRLAAATATAVYIEDNGELRPIPLPHIHGIAATGTRLWILADGLYALDGTTLRRATMDVPHGAHLFASTGGDAWLATTGAVTRASIDTATEDPTWRTQVQPVFSRVCAHCHLPGGSAGIDLSTAASWHADQAELSRRVLVTRTMPPAGTDLTAAERDALAQWLTSQSRPSGASTRR